MFLLQLVLANELLEIPKNYLSMVVKICLKLIVKMELYRKQKFYLFTILYELEEFRNLTKALQSHSNYTRLQRRLGMRMGFMSENLHVLVKTV